LGDRAFSDDPETVTKCGSAVCETLLEYGITPVMKHMPGLGQANVDSHHELPRVSASKEELQKDFSTFKAMTSVPFSNQIWGMVAHVIYEAFDSDQPSTTSPTIINLIREQIGFDGLLLSDDLDMDALGSIGDIPARAKAVLEAGCDIALYCHGNLKIMEELAAQLPPMRTDSLERYDRSRIRRRSAA
ncbi:MAG: glycoside hydrolase family 3 N-terminal domain-containing protein, partial [Pseudomonadota bacterium]